ncbi:hypothetical protein GCM10027080_25770 [Pedococcus soli]
MSFHLTSDAHLASRTEDQLVQLREVLSSRLHLVLNGGVGAFCLGNTIISAWTGRGFWWMWFLATLSHLAALVVRDRAFGRVLRHVGQARPARTHQERISTRYVLAGGFTSALALSIGQAVLPPQDRASVEGARVVIAVALLVVAVVAAIGAMWAAAWKFKEPA